MEEPIGSDLVIYHSRTLYDLGYVIATILNSTTKFHSRRCCCADHQAMIILSRAEYDLR